jgi:hypothetical protein
MTARHVTSKGQPIDMERLVSANADTVALGNASKNARGDQLGPGGVVLRTQEQIEADWAAAKARAEERSKPVDIKSETATPQPVQRPVAAQAKPLTADDQDFEPPMATPAPRRRVTETD